MQDLQRQKICLKRGRVMAACSLLLPTVLSEMLSTITGSASMVRPVHHSQIRSQTVPVKRKDRGKYGRGPVHNMDLSLPRAVHCCL